MFWPCPFGLGIQYDIQVDIHDDNQDETQDDTQHDTQHDIWDDNQDHILNDIKEKICLRVFKNNHQGGLCGKITDIERGWNKAFKDFPFIQVHFQELYVFVLFVVCLQLGGGE